MSTETLDNDITQVGVTGLNFRRSSLALREQFAVSEDVVAEVLDKVRAASGSAEAVLVSTCNRLEVVTAANLKVAAEQQLQLSSKLFNAAVFPNVSAKLSPHEIQPFVYHKTGVDAAQHVFRVASGVDSLVVGETQITGQMKKSLELARNCDAVKANLGRLFCMAFSTAKKVRTATNIGAGSVSVSSVARELAEQIFGSLQGASVLIFGAGEIGELTLRHLHAAGVKKFFIANRSKQRAIDVAQRVGGAVISLDQVNTFLPDVDIVIGASWRAASDPFYLDKQAVRSSLEARSYKPQFFIDLAVPRNFDAAIDSLNDAFLYNVDDLQQIVSENQQERLSAAEQAQEIINIEAQKFLYWLNFRKLSPLLQRLQEQQAFRRPEIWQLMKQLRQTPMDAKRCADLAGLLGPMVSSVDSLPRSDDLREAIERCLSGSLRS